LAVTPFFGFRHCSGRRVTFSGSSPVFCSQFFLIKERENPSPSYMAPVIQISD